MNNTVSAIILLFLLGSCGSSMTFEEQIVNDIKTKVPSGICEEIPKGSVLSNVTVGEIVDIGLQGMTDVSYEFDFETNGKTDHKKMALLYIKNGNNYTLARMGGCEYKPK